MIAALLHAFACVLDLEHCLRWTVAHGELRCAEVTTAPTCEAVDGWHEFTPGVPVCTRACEGGRPTA